FSEGTSCRRAAHNASKANWVLELSSRPESTLRLPCLANPGWFFKFGGTNAGGAPFGKTLGLVPAGFLGSESSPGAMNLVSLSLPALVEDLSLESGLGKSSEPGFFSGSLMSDLLSLGNGYSSVAAFGRVWCKYSIN